MSTYSSRSSRRRDHRPARHGNGGDADRGRFMLDALRRSFAAFNPFSAHRSDDAGKDMPDMLAKQSVTLGRLVKRRIYDDLTWPGTKLRFGWAQLDGRRGPALALGVFSDRDRFAQIALADERGRVFAGGETDMDTDGLEPRFLFGKESRLRLPDGTRFGHVAADPGRMLDVIEGGMVGREQSGRMCWLASWLKTGGRYTIEQVRMPLPRELRYDLEYRDAIAVGFFAAYFIPAIEGLLFGFGAGNIFRRLNREAPMGAIRRCLRDMLDAKAHGMRASGLEEHFADLMHEAGALDDVPGLAAVHGAEPLHLYTSSYSGNYFFTWDTDLAFADVLRTLRIEGNLNRFTAVSAWLERNARIGCRLTENDVTRAQAARIDRRLLDNPALAALRTDESAERHVDLDDGAAAIGRLMDEARRQARQIAASSVDSFASGDSAAATAASADAAAAAGSAAMSDAVSDDEWTYRQTMSVLLRRLRLPYRFDVEFRSNLDGGDAAVAFTAAGASLMPSTRYDETRGDWMTLTDTQRATMGSEYNLRVGLIMAALAFAASDRVRRVSLHIDSIGLEEAIAEQNSAIEEVLSRVVRTFERMGGVGAGYSGSKSDPKDGDVHGDTALSSMARHGEGAAIGDGADGDGAGGAGDAGGAGSSADDAGADRDAVHGTQGATGAMGGDATDATDATDAAGESGDDGDDGDDSIDSRFADLMQGIDFDETAFNVPQGDQDGLSDITYAGTSEEVPFASIDDLNALASGEPQEGSEDGDDGTRSAAVGGEGGANPLAQLRRNPTVRTLVTVTFTREAFLARMGHDGLAHPAHTYEMFDATMERDGMGALKPTEASFDLRDARFAPAGAQEEPELSDTTFDPAVARVLGTPDAAGLSIQRADLLQRAVAEFHRLAADADMPSVLKARAAMALVNRIADPELTELAPKATSALIDGEDTPDFVFDLTQNLNRERLKARDLLFSGQVDQAIETIGTQVDRLDAMFAAGPNVPRYFNSYAERVIYNRMFAISGERTVLIPDDLFYAHMELADVLSQIKGAKAALAHLNAMVAYAPAYPLSHMKLAIQLGRMEDWDSARAACLNALQVSLDRDDAAFAYYRLAYAEWMRDHFDVAVAAYIMSDHIAPGQIGALESELRELMTRADSQCIPVPDGVESAAETLTSHDIPVWPHTQASTIVRRAARVCVDEGLFVPARTLSVACARMNDDDGGIDVVQTQFLRSLNA